MKTLLLNELDSIYFWLASSKGKEVLEQASTLDFPKRSNEFQNLIQKSNTDEESYKSVELILNLAILTNALTNLVELGLAKRENGRLVATSATPQNIRDLFPLELENNSFLKGSSSWEEVAPLILSGFFPNLVNQMDAIRAEVKPEDYTYFLEDLDLINSELESSIKLANTLGVSFYEIPNENFGDLGLVIVTKSDGKTQAFFVSQIGESKGVVGEETEEKSIESKIKKALGSKSKIVKLLKSQSEEQRKESLALLRRSFESIVKKFADKEDIDLETARRILILTALGGKPKNLDTFQKELEQSFNLIFDSLCNLEDQYILFSTLQKADPSNKEISLNLQGIQVQHAIAKEDTLEKVKELEGIFQDPNPLFLSHYGIDKTEDGYSWDSTFPPLQQVLIITDSPEDKKKVLKLVENPSKLIVAGALITVSMIINAYLIYYLSSLQEVVKENSSNVLSNSESYKTLIKRLCENKSLKDSQCASLLLEADELLEKAKSTKDKADKLDLGGFDSINRGVDRALQYLKYGAIAYVSLKTFTFVNDWRKSR